MIDLSSHEMRVMYSFLREASELARRVQGGMTVERHTKGDLSPGGTYTFSWAAPT